MTRGYADTVSGVLAALLLLGAPTLVLVDERTPSVIMVRTLRGLDEGGAASTLIREAAAVLEASSGLRVRSVEQSGVDMDEVARCPGAAILGCLVGQVVSRAAPPTFLFVLSARRVQEGNVLLSLLTVDVLDALALIARGGSADEIEDAIFGSGISGEPEELDPERPEELRGFLQRQLDGGLRDALERRKEWTPFGAIELDGTWADAPVILDGRVLGVSATDTTRLEDLRPGPRHIIVGDGDDIFQASVVVERGRTTRVIVVRPSARSMSLVSWVGLGFATTGAVVVGAAALMTAGQLESRCLYRSADRERSCDAVGFATIGFDASAAPTLDARAVNPPGVSLIPLGVALLVSGGVAALGPQLFDHDLAPLMATIAGVALGAAAYGITSVAAP